MATDDLAPHAGAVNPSTTAHEDQYAPEPVSGERPAVWGDFFTCTGCRDLEECRAAFGNEWGPDGTGCADWSPKP